MREAHRSRRWLGAILIASVAARVWLVLGGGQYYWPDEGLYETSRETVTWMATGERKPDLLRRLDRGDHLLFKFIGLVPAALEHVAGRDLRIPGLFFSVFSTVNIWLLWLIAHRLGAREPEALAAAGLLAASASFLYYARHVLPYDTAMTFGLLAVYAGVRAAPRAASSFTCGFLAGCTFLTYSGYWTLGAAALLIHVTWDRTSWRDAARRAVAAGAGLATPIAAALLVSAAYGGQLLATYLRFSGTIDQGTYEEGWRLPFEYLWHAEHLLLPLWMAAVAASLWHARSAGASRRVVAGLVALATIYGALVVTSVVLERFVVYGRLARQLVPFLCLIGAHELERLRTSMRPPRPLLAPVVAGAVLLQAVLNFWQPITQQFPLDFLDRFEPAVETLGSRAHAWTHVRHIYPAPDPVSLPAGHVVIGEARHPLEFLPYQYEGYTPLEREGLRSTDIRMRLVAMPE